MPATVTGRNRFVHHAKQHSGPSTQKRLNSASAKPPTTRLKKARATREGDEDIVREARSDDDSQSDPEDDDDDSSFTSSIASVPERPLTRKASNSKQATTAHRSASDPSSSALPIMQFPEEDVNGRALLSSLQDAHHAWSDMVAHADEGADLPVLDFADMRAPSPLEYEESTSAVPARNERTEAKRGAFQRPVGVSARQAYLQRLEADPSYTPRVGEFWSHDERLLDKDLRSLSGWWRGRWRGRGRGGFGAGWVNRGGRGGRFTGREQWGTTSESNDPIDQDWRHDGFEEIEQAKEAKAAKQQSEQTSDRGFWSPRGRGRGGAIRGGFSHTADQTSSSHERTHSFSARPSPGPRLWYRPEYAWTKHSATFLFFDGFSKPRFGDGGRVRVKLPGQTRYTLIRLPPVETKSEPATSTSSQPTRHFVVKLPRTKNAEETATRQTTPAPIVSQPEDAHTVALPPILDEPNASALVAPTTPTMPVPILAEPVPELIAELPAPAPPAQLEQIPVPEPAPAAIQQAPDIATLAMPPPPATNQPMLQMVPTPTAPSPSYPSPSYAPGPFPYPLHHPVATYPAPMPESMWYDPRMPYGYPTPPPAPQNMYTPPPPASMHHHHHSHSHSISLPPMIPTHGPSFYGMPPPPVPRPAPIEQLSSSISYGPNGAIIDTATGSPIFSLAKARVKVAIRKPGETPSPSTAPNESMSSEGSSRDLTTIGSESTQSIHPPEELMRPKGLERRATDPAPSTFSANNPYALQAQAQPQSQPQWDGYGNHMGGYFYPHPPPPMHPHQYPSSAEFGYVNGIPPPQSGYAPYSDPTHQGSHQPPHPSQHPQIFY